MMEKKQYNIRPDIQEKYRQFMELMPDTRDENNYLKLKPDDIAGLGSETLACLLMPTKGPLVKFSQEASDKIMEGLSYYGDPPEIDFIRKNLKTRNADIKNMLKNIEQLDSETWKSALLLVCLYQCRDMANMDSFEEICEEIVYDSQNF